MRSAGACSCGSCADLCCSAAWRCGNCSVATCVCVQALGAGERCAALYPNKDSRGMAEAQPAGQLRACVGCASRTPRRCRFPPRLPRRPRAPPPPPPPPPPRARAGLPKGVLNIVHGTHDTVNRILDHPDISAISFVGSSECPGGQVAAGQRMALPGVHCAALTACVNAVSSGLCQTMWQGEPAQRCPCPA